MHAKIEERGDAMRAGQKCVAVTMDHAKMGRGGLSGCFSALAVGDDVGVVTSLAGFATAAGRKKRSACI